MVAALPKRRNLVLPRTGCVPCEGMQAVASVNHAIGISAVDGDELCVIGGGEVYVLALPLATWMHLTLVDTVAIGADAFFPRFDAADWRITTRDAHPADAANAFGFEFVDYRRID